MEFLLFLPQSLSPTLYQLQLDQKALPLLCNFLCSLSPAVVDKSIVSILITYELKVITHTDHDVLIVE